MAEEEAIRVKGGKMEGSEGENRIWTRKFYQETGKVDGEVNMRERETILYIIDLT